VRHLYYLYNIFIILSSYQRRYRVTAITCASLVHADDRFNISLALQITSLTFCNLHVHISMPLNGLLFQSFKTQYNKDPNRKHPL
jgi:hypothetical protein